MADHFARLNFPRRPWLDSEQLQQRFHDLSADAHPDQSHTDDPKAKAGHDSRERWKPAAAMALVAALRTLRGLGG